MILNKVSILLNIIYFLTPSASSSIWDFPPALLNNFLNRETRSSSDITNKTSNASVESSFENVCDENQLMLQLAKIYIISPESIILLLTTTALSDTCLEISRVFNRINTKFSGCKHLPKSNLYMRLYDSLKHFDTEICHPVNTTKKIKRINDYQECLVELREELMECEGPPDWFEKRNKTVTCQYFDEIIKCNYVKTAILCGEAAALLLRNFSADIMNIVLMEKCTLSKHLPHVDNPMPSNGNSACLDFIFVLLFPSMTFILLIYDF